MFKLKINDVGVINNADISISKINVVGGINSSGKTTVSRILYCFLKTFAASHSDSDYLKSLIVSEGLGDFTDSDISFKSDEISFKLSDANFDYSPLDINEVFYMDSISVFDLKNLEILNMEHIKHMKESLEDDSKNDTDFDIFDDFEFREVFCSKTPAGIKQIGIIQTLLYNGRLKENSYLIIDEPEANLHPEWQIKFAQILVLLVKKLNIKIYLNSHSPMFIEAISLYSQYYGILENTGFYLTQRQENGKFTFTHISSDDMGAVYENLTKPFDELDRLRAKILFME